MVRNTTRQAVAGVATPNSSDPQITSGQPPTKPQTVPRTVPQTVPAAVSPAAQVEAWAVEPARELPLAQRSGRAGERHLGQGLLPRMPLLTRLPGPVVGWA